MSHRDIKPENILIVGDMVGGIAKIADFGSLKEINYFEDNQTFLVGTPLYFAPEKKSKSYTEKVDVWSMGIILFEMLNGRGHPIDYDFKSGNLLDYLTKLPDLPIKQMPAFVSPECQRLVKSLLIADPDKRPSVFDVLNMPIIKEKLKMITEGMSLGPEIAEIVAK